VTTSGAAAAGRPRGLRPVGDTGWLLEPPGTGDAVADAVAVLALAAAVRAGAAGLPAVDVVPGAATVLVTCPPARHAELGRALAALPVPGVPAAAASPADPRPGPVTLAVRFDGPDLPEVAALTGLDPDGVVRRLAAAAWTVAFLGFAPGFGYLVGGGLDIPRRADPRTRVPGGAVGLAGPYAGVYPRPSPGGWRLVGTLAKPAPRLFDPNRRPPALLTPGATMRLVAAR
jgi:allophanate hydrolase subunit 1